MKKLKSLFYSTAISLVVFNIYSCGNKVNKDVSNIDLFPVKTGDKFQYIDAGGKVITNPQFQDATVFRNGLALVKSDGKEPKFGFIDKEGKMVINTMYKYATVFSEDIAWVVQEKGAPTSINKKGEIITSLGNASIVNIYKEGLAAFAVTDKDETKWGFVDKTGKVVINPQFKSTKNFSDGKCAVQNNDGKWGYIDKEGKIAISYQFENANAFNNGKAVVVSGEKSGLIDNTGKYIINPQFQSIFNDGDLYCIMQDKKFGWCDKDGKMVINPQFDDAYPFGNNELAAVSSGETWGYVDKNGKYIINTQFDDAFPFNGKLALVKSSGKYGFVDNKGKIVINPQYDGVANDFSTYVLDGSTNYDHVVTDKQASQNDVASNDSENNGDIENNTSDNNENESNNNENENSNNDANSSYLGTYAGPFGTQSIKLVIENINGSNVTGYNVVGTNRRPVSGKVNNGFFELSEPGTDKWDGVFTFSVKGNLASGVWKSNNGKLTQVFAISKS